MPAQLEHPTARAFFQEQIERAMSHQRLAASSDSGSYLAQLLEDFVRPERLFVRAGAEPDQPLAEIFCLALAADGCRKLALLKLAGDLSLFVAGFFPDSLSRSLASADYYVKLGGRAYGTLSSEASSTAIALLFDELAGHFRRFADVLNEVSHECTLVDDGNLLRLYDTWLTTRSRRSARVLRERGIMVVPTASSAVH
ncbi:MAG: hypothetical protein HC897_17895 [Thermoanaerobaculia bacterium]|nr:hypothetical protein [Thermoanaerobaculia bacterium]